ncbi:MAG: adenine phosphoribosyltransferase [Planctomycetota bacterium]
MKPLEKLDKLVRRIPHFPKEGIIFYDITTLIKDADGFRIAVDMLADRFKKDKIDLVAGMEARGFIFGAAVALKLGTGFIPIRKPGKLPGKSISETYQLEYGKDTLEIHVDAIHEKKSRILLIDDLLATGGTLEASAKLVEKLGGTVVACGVVIELTFLPGRERLKKYKLESLIQYRSEEVESWDEVFPV